LVMNATAVQTSTHNSYCFLWSSRPRAFRIIGSTCHVAMCINMDTIKNIGAIKGSSTNTSDTPRERAITNRDPRADRTASAPKSKFIAETNVAPIDITLANTSQIRLLSILADSIGALNGRCATEMSYGSRYINVSTRHIAFLISNRFYP
jgi:hypothetical protein